VHKHDVWLDGDFISAFASLVCHNNHSLVQRALMKSGQDVKQLTHVTFPKSHMTINDYKALPSSVKWVEVVMHTNQQTGSHPSWSSLLHLGFFLVHSYVGIGLCLYSTVTYCQPVQKNKKPKKSLCYSYNKNSIVPSCGKLSSKTGP
jgi:hypothetical protein